MNEKIHILDLFKFVGEKHPYGAAKGRKAHSRLLAHIDSIPNIPVIGISLSNIESADISFFREAVIYTAKRYSKQISFFVCGIEDEDIFDNLDGAADSGDFRLTCWVGKECRFVGPKPSASSKALLELVIDNREATTAEAAAALDISVQNASTRLKRLSDEGFLLRSEAAAETGGKEFVYQVIGQSA
ncbi:MULTISPECIES: winged helix-turn-helix transcriptional regulator [unclassified Pseudomonas]|uniref:winged helix-turn-helix transcriptional regulator n=1 Tax=unclassified Pseudomonas TaxID=196821 RepID=UPI00244BE2F5|nr:MULTISPECIES: winged helix-turn-helix transcriptional regulator [unclassified Pseudomonas]MDG9927967.1 winged helix-turn-helix transcriptional regulator [Pseudomonas sp. GD04042]MDH0481976.1 winged helix-turn-helix transcriptional regulator [Pseudomonas sp. GD04015]MDH0604129.1 winged helix-turn-helix transcriptional regulator [Pseudomonas sp. GD03869]